MADPGGSTDRLSAAVDRLMKDLIAYLLSARPANGVAHGALDFLRAHASSSPLPPPEPRKVTRDDRLYTAQEISPLLIQVQCCDFVILPLSPKTVGRDEGPPFVVPDDGRGGAVAARRTWRDDRRDRRALDRQARAHGGPPGPLVAAAHAEH